VQSATKAIRPIYTKSNHCEVGIMRFATLRLVRGGTYLRRYNKYSGMVLSLFVGENAFAVCCPACPRLPYVLVTPYVRKVLKKNSVLWF
jgi:hypothetical protein